ncbi:carbohydrate ABC transporter permease [Paenibacillus cymbidii]|uniref:carbohydrate ABC transporter permease n=1 Tax=Paenibacillus cymbidii TaxID=1639034 RepID=UPI001080FBC3|nr:carbohydrate ABC transporter permease [Paenibacillus cymbidii]
MEQTKPTTAKKRELSPIAARKRPGSVLFDGINYTLLLLYALICFIPILHVFATSIAASSQLADHPFLLIPTRFSMEGFQFIFSSNTVPRSLLTTILITVVGTGLNVIVTSLIAYPLSRKYLKGRNPVMLMIVFTMLFSGGLIPNFLLVKALGLLNSYWSLWLTGLVSPFILIILKNFFQALPEEVEESAKIDGANEPVILFRIILPLSLPAIATIALFYAVGHWNTFMSAILYMNNQAKWPIQVLLRQIVTVSTAGIGDDEFAYIPPSNIIRSAVIVVATLPILLVYPFLQRYFTKGIMLGSVKG